ncbi:MAG: DUF6599 family protein [Acidobacteriota bacterium]
MATRAFALAALALLACACGAPPPPAPAAPATVDLARLLPAFGDLAGWQVDDGPREYLSDTLFEVLDGGAPVYFAHGFRRLLQVRYRLGDDPSACVTLGVFDMGSDLGAFGIYRSVLPAGASLRAWGAEGHRAGSLAAAWSGRVFVHALADDERPALVEMAERLVAGACARAGGATAMPTALAALPPVGRIERSERVVARDLFGHEFLPGGVTATYRLGEADIEAFYTDIGSERGAREALDELRAHEAAWGRVHEGPLPSGVEGFHFSDPGLGEGVAVRTGRWVAGVHGGSALTERERLLTELVGGLTRQPGLR